MVNGKSPIDFNESRISLPLMSKTQVTITYHNLIKREGKNILSKPIISEKGSQECFWQVLVLGKSQHNMQVGPYWCKSLFKGGFISTCSLPPHTWTRGNQRACGDALNWCVDASMHWIIHSHLQNREGPELCSKVDCFSAFCPLSYLLLIDQACFYSWQH